LEHRHFELSMGLLICFNIGVMVAEANANVPCDIGGEGCDSRAIAIFRALNRVLLFVYFVEAVSRLYAFRCAFFANRWNLIDSFIVFCGLVDIIIVESAKETNLPSVQLLRVFRVLRLARAARVLEAFPELYTYLRGFAGAMKAMFWGFLVILFILLLLSIFAVELLHPRLVEFYPVEHECTIIFSSVEHSVVSFFLMLVVGDSWADCAVPFILTYWWPFFVFAGAFMAVQLGLLNLVLSVIVDKAADAREADIELKANQRTKEQEKSGKRLLEIIRNIDQNLSGDISIQELLQGYDGDDEFQRVVTLLNIDRDELGELFRCMDEDDTGLLEYGEFVRHVQKAQSQDLRVQFMVLKMEVLKMSHSLQRQSREIHEAIREMQGVALSMASPPLQQLRNAGALTRHPCASPELTHPALEAQAPSVVGFDEDLRQFRSGLDARLESIMHEVATWAVGQVEVLAHRVGTHGPSAFPMHPTRTTLLCSSVSSADELAPKANGSPKTGAMVAGAFWRLPGEDRCAHSWV